jgi:cbb3-type cytochrome oxidase maturation protein
MSILLLLIPLALMLLIVAIVAFAWAVRGGQFEDLETPALSILADDDAPPRQEPGDDA